MMGPNFWAGLAERVGFKVNQAGAPMVRVAAQAVGEAVEVPHRIPVVEAKAAGFFKLASNMGWGLYRVEDIDGGLGSIWSIEKDAETGGQFLVKQTDPAGEVMRLKTAGVMSRASTPPGKEKMVKELKKNPDAENPWAVAWSKYDQEKKARLAAGSQSEILSQWDAKAREMFGKGYAELPDDGPEQDAVVHAVQMENGGEVIIKEDGPNGR